MAARAACASASAAASPRRSTSASCNRVGVGA
jgi:hypothetical protein